MLSAAKPTTGIAAESVAFAGAIVGVVPETPDMYTGVPLAIGLIVSFFTTSVTVGSAYSKPFSLSLTFSTWSRVPIVVRPVPPLAVGKAPFSIPSMRISSRTYCYKTII